MLLLLSNSKEIKQETENKHSGLSELMVGLVFLWTAFLEGAVHHCSAQYGPGRGTAVTLGEGSRTDTNEQDLWQGMGIKWTAPDTKQHQI